MKKIALVSCCAKKAKTAMPARALYTSPLFNLSRSYAERFCDDWLILSARHHVLRPYQVVTPYDERLPTSEKWLSVWGHKTTELLLAALPEPVEVVVLAGEDYIWCSEGSLRKAGHTITKPLLGMQIGQRLSFLTQAIKEAA